MTAQNIFGEPSIRMGVKMGASVLADGAYWSTDGGATWQSGVAPLVTGDSILFRGVAAGVDFTLTATAGYLTKNDYSTDQILNLVSVGVGYFVGSYSGAAMTAGATYFLQCLVDSSLNNYGTITFDTPVSLVLSYANDATGFGTFTWNKANPTAWNVEFSVDGATGWTALEYSAGNVNFPASTRDFYAVDLGYYRVKAVGGAFAGTVSNVVQITDL